MSYRWSSGTSSSYPFTSAWALLQQTDRRRTRYSWTTEPNPAADPTSHQRRGARVSTPIARYRKRLQSDLSRSEDTAARGRKGRGIPVRENEPSIQCVQNGVKRHEKLTREQLRRVTRSSASSWIKQGMWLLRLWLIVVVKNFWRSVCWGIPHLWYLYVIWCHETNEFYHRMRESSMISRSKKSIFSAIFVFMNRSRGWTRFNMRSTHSSSPVMTYWRITNRSRRRRVSMWTLFEQTCFYDPRCRHRVRWSVGHYLK